MILLLLDQGLPRSLVSELAARDIGMATAADAKIIQKAVELNAAVVTFDPDFHSILANINGTLPSVVRIRIEGLKAPELAKLLHKTIQLAKQEILDGSAITITQNGIRVHRLPL